MLTTFSFTTAAQWAGILTIVCGALAVLAFIFQWGIRFRVVGATGFMGVLTVGLWGLSLGLYSRSVVPDAVRYSQVYDSGGSQVVIAVPPQVTESQVEATLRQAAADLFSYGRLGQGENKLTVRLRTIVHPEKGISEPLYLGQVRRSLASRDDDNFAIEIYQDKLAKLPKPTA